MEINSKLDTDSTALVVTVCLVALLFVSALAILALMPLALETLTDPRPTDSYASFIALTVFVISWPLVLIGGIVLRQRAVIADREERTTQLFYELDDMARGRYTKLLQAFERLSKSAAIWSREGGKAERKRIHVGRFEIPGIRTDIPVYGIAFGHMFLFFVPDQILVFRNKKYV